MKIIGLDEQEYTWKYHLHQTPRENCSAPHERARKLLKELFPFSSICEEVPLIGVGKEKLFIDFFIPQKRLVVEVQGQQHYHFNHFFFSSKQAFGKALNRDRTKVEWCKINNFDFVELPDNEKDKEWEMRIKNR